MLCVLRPPIPKSLLKFHSSSQIGTRELTGTCKGADSNQDQVETTSQKLTLTWKGGKWGGQRQQNLNQ